MRKLFVIITALAMLISASAFSQEKSSKAGKKGKKYDKWENQQDDEEEQDTVRPFEFGLNFGAYFPNKYSANFYNGIPTNVNTVNYVMSNKYWYQDIKKALLASDTVMVYSDSRGGTGYPLNMHYTVAFTGGLFMRVNFDRKNGIFLQANYTRLTASDLLVLHVDPIQYVGELPDLRYMPIVGKEGRVLIDLGYQRSFPMKSKIYFFVQAAATMCYTQMISSVFNVEGVDYNMVNIYGTQGYIPGNSSQTFNINQNAFGFGGFLGAGAGIPLTDMFSLEPNFFMQVYPTNLTKYTEYRPSFGVSLRILISFAKSGDK